MENNFYNLDDYIFFWGGILSNFYITPIIIDGILYNSSEQYFMKIKQETFDPLNVQLGKDIMKENNPKNIKNFGRNVNNYQEDIWDQMRYNVMYKGVYEKFYQNKNLRDILLETENKILVESSPYDKVWGIGLNENEAKLIHPSKWEGKNLLGKVLMEVRKKLKNKK